MSEEKKIEMTLTKAERDVLDKVDLHAQLLNERKKRLELEMHVTNQEFNALSQQSLQIRDEIGKRLGVDPMLLLVRRDGTVELSKTPLISPLQFKREE